MTEYEIGDPWQSASMLGSDVAPHSVMRIPSLAAEGEVDGRGTTLLVGADDDYDVFEEAAEFAHLTDRFRDDHA